MKLSQWAKNRGIRYGTALKWFHSGVLPVVSYQLPTGTILVEEEEKSIDKTIKTVAYARVSSAIKKEDLHSQLCLIEDFCLKNGWILYKSFKEIASGMNDNRPKLNKILDEKNIRLVVLHKDRLTRFGFNYVQRCIESKGGKVVVINPNKTEEDDLLKDFIAIITSFCCRLYGARRGQANALKMKDVISTSKNNDKLC